MIVSRSNSIFKNDFYNYKHVNIKFLNKFIFLIIKENTNITHIFKKLRPQGDFPGQPIRMIFRSNDSVYGQYFMRKRA